VNHERSAYRGPAEIDGMLLNRFEPNFDCHIIWQF
jgi:hypothetical protein